MNKLIYLRPEQDKQPAIGGTSVVLWLTNTSAFNEWLTEY